MPMCIYTHTHMHTHDIFIYTDIIYIYIYICLNYTLKNTLTVYLRILAQNDKHQEYILLKSLSFKGKNSLMKRIRLRRKNQIRYHLTF